MAPETGNPNQVSDFRIKLSYWYITHKVQLRQALIGFLILFSVVSYGFSIYRMLMIFVVEGQTLEQDLTILRSNLIDYSYFHEANKPQELQVISFDGIASDNGLFDFIGKVSNPNEDEWVAAEVVYELLVGAEVVAEKTSFIYPGEEKYLAFFGQEVKPGFTPVLRIDKVRWRRYNQFNNFAGPRLRFEVSDIEFRTARESGIRGDLPVSTLSFNITNRTAFSYWQVGLYIGLVNASRPFAANFLALDQFLSGEERNVEIRWYDAIPAAGQTEIFPEVDIIDPASYMPVN